LNDASVSGALALSTGCECRFLSNGLPLRPPKLAALARPEEIYMAQKFSDHAPLTIDYDFDL